MDNIEIGKCTIFLYERVYHQALGFTLSCLFRIVSMLEIKLFIAAVPPGTWGGHRIFMHVVAL